MSFFRRSNVPPPTTSANFDAYHRNPFIPDPVTEEIVGTEMVAARTFHPTNIHGHQLYDPYLVDVDYSLIPRAAFGNLDLQGTLGHLPHGYPQLTSRYPGGPRYLEQYYLTAHPRNIRRSHGPVADILRQRVPWHREPGDDWDPSRHFSGVAIGADGVFRVYHAGTRRGEIMDFARHRAAGAAAAAAARRRALRLRMGQDARQAAAMVNASAFRTHHGTRRATMARIAREAAAVGARHQLRNAWRHVSHGAAAAGMARLRRLQGWRNVSHGAAAAGLARLRRLRHTRQAAGPPARYSSVFDTVAPSLTEGLLSYLPGFLRPPVRRGIAQAALGLNYGIAGARIGRAAIGAAVHPIQTAQEAAALAAETRDLINTLRGAHEPR